MLRPGDWGPSTVVDLKGPLLHWQHDEHAAATWATYSREDIAGLYDVGGASLDVTDLHEARWLTHQDVTYGLAFDLLSPSLSDEVVISVVWGAS